VIATVDVVARVARPVAVGAAVTVTLVAAVERTPITVADGAAVTVTLVAAVGRTAMSVADRAAVTVTLVAAVAANGGITSATAVRVAVADMSLVCCDFHGPISPSTPVCT
jgi:hypothetical protein